MKIDMIRFFQEQDKESILSCIVEFQNFEKKLQVDRLSGDQISNIYFNYLLDQVKTNCGQFLVAENEGKIVGYACFWIENNFGNGCLSISSHVRLSDIFVFETSRGKGFGKMLLNKIEDYARQKGQKRILLNVLSNNIDTIAMYNKVGYKPYELIMTKDID